MGSGDQKHYEVISKILKFTQSLESSDTKMTMGFFFKDSIIDPILCS